MLGLRVRKGMMRFGREDRQSIVKQQSDGVIEWHCTNRGLVGVFVYECMCLQCLHIFIWMEDSDHTWYNCYRAVFAGRKARWWMLGDKSCWWIALMTVGLAVPRYNGVWFLCMETSYLRSSSRLYIICMIVTYILYVMSIGLYLSLFLCIYVLSVSISIWLVPFTYPYDIYYDILFLMIFTTIY